MEGKKKSGKLKKIIIAIIAVVVIAAIIIGILVATGKLEFNFSKKSKMVAGVERLGETVTEPLDKISETAEENGTTVKVLEKMNADSAMEVSTEITANVDKISSPEFSSSDKSAIKTATDVINDSKLNMNFRYDGNESIYAKIDGSVGSESVSGEAVYDGKQVGVRSEELNSTWLTISKEDIEDLMEENGITSTTLKMDEMLTESTAQIDKLAKAVEVDEKTRKKITKRYKDVLKDYINDKSKDIESEKDKVNVDGKEKSCSKLTLELDDDDLKDLLKAYVKEFSKDEDMKKILNDVFDVYADIIEESGEKKTANQLRGALDLVYDNLDSLTEQIDEISFDGKVKLIVYATTTNVYRTDIVVEAEGTSIKLETTFNKETTVTNISMSSNGMNIKIGTLTLTTTDDTLGLRFELNKSLLNMAGMSGDKYYFDIKYKNSKNKSELTFDGKAGEYGYAKLSSVTNIEKNTDSEYADTTTFTIDVDAPDYLTTKLSLTMKNNIKLGNVSIPSIKDSVNMTDEKAVEEYGKEAGENAKALIDKFSKVKSLEPLMEDLIDEIGL